jgi:hypothetical protein
VPQAKTVFPAGKKILQIPASFLPKTPAWHESWFQIRQFFEALKPDLPCPARDWRFKP